MCDFEYSSRRPVTNGRPLFRLVIAHQEEADFTVYDPEYQAVVVCIALGTRQQPDRRPGIDSNVPYPLRESSFGDSVPDALFLDGLKKPWLYTESQTLPIVNADSTSLIPPIWSAWDWRRVCRSCINMHGNIITGFVIFKVSRYDYQHSEALLSPVQKYKLIHPACTDSSSLHHNRQAAFHRRIRQLVFHGG